MGLVVSRPDRQIEVEASDVHLLVVVRRHPQARDLTVEKHERNLRRVGSVDGGVLLVESDGEDDRRLEAPRPR